MLPAASDEELWTGVSISEREGVGQILPPASAAGKMRGMDLALPLHLLLIVLAFDVAAVGFFLAGYVDRVLLGEPRWRFGLGTLLNVVTLATVNLGLIMVVSL